MQVSIVNYVPFKDAVLTLNDNKVVFEGLPYPVSTTVVNSDAIDEVFGLNGLQSLLIRSNPFRA